MVKFGRHLQFYLECEHPASETSHYFVPYNKLRDEQIEFKQPQLHLNPCSFEAAWREALRLATDDFQESTTSCWKTVFEAISSISNARGAGLEMALRLYTPTVGISPSQDLLVFLKGIYSAAAKNSEALRKLVKKFDKHIGSIYLSDVLLPELYSSNFFMGQNVIAMAISVLRELLDDLDEVYDDHNDHNGNMSDYLNQNGFQNHEESDEFAVSRRAEEMMWLREMTQHLQKEDIEHAVAHRGFHNPRGRSDLRPLENSLAAFEAAWSNGVHLCECDVALTKDEKIVLAHDDDFTRLALDPASNLANVKVCNLTFKELIALTLKNGVRAPLLLDVLRSAREIGPDAKLIIEIKPGHDQAGTALARLFGRYPSLVAHVEVVMSFDLWAMHTLRDSLNRTFRQSHIQSMDNNQSNSRNSVSHSTKSDRIRALSVDSTFDDCHDSTLSSQIALPKLMLLTVAGPPTGCYELWTDVHDYSSINGWLRTDNSNIDGVYVQFQSEMMEADGALKLRALSQKFAVGVWGLNGIDPDDYKTMNFLVKNCGVTYFNTDLPRDFLGMKSTQMISV